MHRTHTERASGARPHAAGGGAPGRGGALLGEMAITGAPNPETQWGEGGQTPFQASCLHLLLSLGGKLENPGEEIRERIPPSGLGVGSAPSSPPPPQHLSHWLRLLPRTHPPGHLSLSPPCSPPLLRAQHPVPESWRRARWGQVEEEDGGQFQALRQWQGQGTALASSLPPSRVPLDPWRLPHLPCLPPPQVSSGERSARAPRIRARPHEHARAATLARISPTSKFIHKTLRLSQAQRRGS